MRRLEKLILLACPLPNRGAKGKGSAEPLKHPGHF
jgi:hypothetical protein